MANTDNLKDQPTGSDKTRTTDHAENSSTGLTINDVHTAAPKAEKSDAGFGLGAVKGVWDTTAGAIGSMFQKSSAEEILASKHAMGQLLTRPDKAVANAVDTLQHGTAEEKGHLVGSVVGFVGFGAAGSVAAKFAAFKGAGAEAALATTKASEALSGMDTGLGTALAKPGVFSEPMTTGALAKKTEDIGNMLGSAKPAEHGTGTANKEPRISAPVKDVPPAKLGGPAPDPLSAALNHSRADAAITATHEPVGALNFEMPPAAEPVGLPKAAGHLDRAPAPSGVLEIPEAPVSAADHTELSAAKPHITDHPTGTIGAGETPAPRLPHAQSQGAIGDGAISSGAPHVPARPPASSIPAPDAQIPTISTDLSGDGAAVSGNSLEHTAAQPVQRAARTPLDHADPPAVDHADPAPHAQVPAPPADKVVAPRVPAAEAAPTRVNNGAPVPPELDVEAQTPAPLRVDAQAPKPVHIDVQPPSPVRMEAPQKPPVAAAETALQSDQVQVLARQVEALRPAGGVEAPQVKAFNNTAEAFNKEIQRIAEKGAPNATDLQSFRQSFEALKDTARNAGTSIAKIDDLEKTFNRNMNSLSHNIEARQTSFVDKAMTSAQKSGLSGEDLINQVGREVSSTPAWQEGAQAARASMKTLRSDLVAEERAPQVRTTGDTAGSAHAELLKRNFERLQTVEKAVEKFLDPTTDTSGNSGRLYKAVQDSIRDLEKSLPNGNEALKELKQTVSALSGEQSSVQLSAARRVLADEMKTVRPKLSDKGSEALTQFEKSEREAATAGTEADRQAAFRQAMESRKTVARELDGIAATAEKDAAATTAKADASQSPALAKAARSANSAMQQVSDFAEQTGLKQSTRQIFNPEAGIAKIEGPVSTKPTPNLPLPKAEPVDLNPGEPRNAARDTARRADEETDARRAPAPAEAKIETPFDGEQTKLLRTQLDALKQQPAYAKLSHEIEAIEKAPTPSAQMPEAGEQVRTLRKAYGEFIEKARAAGPVSPELAQLEQTFARNSNAFADQVAQRELTALRGESASAARPAPTRAEVQARAKKVVTDTPSWQADAQSVQAGLKATEAKLSGGVQNGTVARELAPTKAAPAEPRVPQAEAATQQPTLGDQIQALGEKFQKFEKNPSATGVAQEVQQQISQVESTLQKVESGAITDEARHALQENIKSIKQTFTGMADDHAQMQAAFSRQLLRAQVAESGIGTSEADLTGSTNLARTAQKAADDLSATNPPAAKAIREAITDMHADEQAAVRAQVERMGQPRPAEPTVIDARPAKTIEPARVQSLANDTEASISNLRTSAKIDSPALQSESTTLQQQIESLSRDSITPNKAFEVDRQFGKVIKEAKAVGATDAQLTDLNTARAAVTKEMSQALSAPESTPPVAIRETGLRDNLIRDTEPTTFKLSPEKVDSLAATTDRYFTALRKNVQFESPTFDMESSRLQTQLKSLHEEPLTVQKIETIDQQFAKVIKEALAARIPEAQLSDLRAVQQSVRSDLFKALGITEPVATVLTASAAHQAPPSDAANLRRTDVGTAEPVRKVEPTTANRLVDATDAHVTDLRESAGIKSPAFEKEASDLRTELTSVRDSITPQKVETIAQQFGKVIHEAEQAGATDAQLQGLKGAQKAVKSELTEALGNNEPAPVVRPMEQPRTVEPTTANRLLDATDAHVTDLRESAGIKSPAFEKEATDLRTELTSVRDSLTPQKVETIDQQFGKVIHEAEQAGATDAQLRGLKAAQKAVKSELTEALGGTEPAPAVRPTPGVRPATPEPVELQPAAARPLEQPRAVEPITANRLVDATDAHITSLRESAEIKSPVFEREATDLRTELSSVRDSITPQKVETIDQQFGKVIHEAEQAGATDAQLQGLKAAQKAVKSELTEALGGTEPAPVVRPMEQPRAVEPTTANRLLDATDAHVTDLRESANIKSPAFEKEATDLRTELSSVRDSITPQKVETIDQQFGKVIHEAEQAGATDAQLRGLKAAQKAVKSELTEALGGTEPVAPVRPAATVRQSAPAPSEAAAELRPAETPGPRPAASVRPATLNRIVDETDASISRLRESADIKSPEFGTESKNLTDQLKSLRDQPLSPHDVEAVDQQFNKVLQEAEKGGATADQMANLKAAQRSIKSELTEALGGTEPAPAVRPAATVRQPAPAPSEAAELRPAETPGPRPAASVRPATVNRIVDETDASISRLRESADIKSPAFETESKNLTAQLKLLKDQPLSPYDVEAVDQQFNKVLQEAEKGGATADQMAGLKAAQKAVRSELTEALGGTEPAPVVRPMEQPRTVEPVTANRLVDATDAHITSLRESAEIKSPVFEKEATDLRTELSSVRDSLTPQKVETIAQQFGKVIHEAEQAGATDAQLQGLKAAQKAVKSELTEALGGTEPAPAVRPTPGARPATPEAVESQPSAARPLEQPPAVERITANRLIDETDAHITNLRESAEIKSPAFEKEATDLRTELSSVRDSLTPQKVETIDQQFGKVIHEAEQAGATDAQLQGLKAAQKAVKSELTEALGGTEPAPAVRPTPGVRTATPEPVELPAADARTLEQPRAVERITANRLIDETDAHITNLRESAEIKSPAFEKEATDLRTELTSVRDSLTPQKVETIDQQFGKVIHEAEQAGATDAQLQGLKAARKAVNKELADTLSGTEPAPAAPREFTPASATVEQPAPKLAPATADTIAAETRTGLESLRTDAGITSEALERESGALTRQLGALRTEPVNLERALEVDRQFARVIEEAKAANATEAQLQGLNAAREMTARELGATIGETEAGAAARPVRFESADQLRVDPRRLEGAVETHVETEPLTGERQPHLANTDDAPAPLQQARQRVASAADDLRSAQAGDELTTAARRQLQELEGQYKQAVADYNEQLRARMAAAGEAPGPQLREPVQAAREQLAQDRLERASEAKLALPVELRGLADDAIYATSSKAYAKALKQFTNGVNEYIQKSLRAGDQVSPALIDDAQKVVRSAQEAMIARTMARQTDYAWLMHPALNDFRMANPTAASVISRSLGAATALTLGYAETINLARWMNRTAEATASEGNGNQATPANADADTRQSTAASPANNAAMTAQTRTEAPVAPAAEIRPAAEVSTAADERRAAAERQAENDRRAEDERREENERRMAAAAAASSAETRDRSTNPIIQASMPAGPAILNRQSETYAMLNSVSGALFGSVTDAMRRSPGYIAYTGFRPDGQLTVGVPSVAAASEAATPLRAMTPIYRSAAGADDLPRPLNPRFDISQPTRISLNGLAGRNSALANPYMSTDARRFGQGGVGSNKDPKAVTQRLAYVASAADRLTPINAAREANAEAAEQHNPDQNTGTATAQTTATASLQMAAQEPPAGTATASNGQEPDEDTKQPITLTTIT